MSEFYGYLQGNRGVVTRCGSINSGINAHIKSWHTSVHAYLDRDNEGDVLTLIIPTGLRVIVNGVRKTIR